MNKPEMILFDYGHTLLYEPGFDAERMRQVFFLCAMRAARRMT